ncbi:MAG TPA: helix-turn-helix transcriptional regulator, partial [Prolixibacteraceae bacterium]
MKHNSQQRNKKYLFHARKYCIIAETFLIMASIDIEKFAQLVRNKRGNRNLRDIANEIGEVSISTLSRIEQGKIPDLSTYMKICEWLEMSANEFELNAKPAEKNHMEEIFFHLRADQSLSQEVSDALAKMIELAYKN